MTKYQKRISDPVLDRIFRYSGIDLEITSAEEEARLIHLAVVYELSLKDKRSSPVDKRTLLIDIGGCSVEVTISTGQNIISRDNSGMGMVRQRGPCLVPRPAA
ncbi:MAG: hypothetical protein EHM40_03165 [Chloroflexi bacterium]|nr:MAG: hypothetical protein EHM40_03165 [Chloroflexota bacterium]